MYWLLFLDPFEHALSPWSFTFGEGFSWFCFSISWILSKSQCRLLNPDLESSGSLFVGSYILQLILHLPSQMAPHVRDLVAALVRRMQSAQIAGLRSSLLLIFARLVLFNFSVWSWLCQNFTSYSAKNNFNFSAITTFLLLQLFMLAI